MRRRPVPFLSRLLPTGLVALGAAACGGGKESAAAAPPPRGRARVEPVQVAVAELATTGRAVTATGQVEPVRTVGVVSQVAGVLQDVRVEEGDYVAEGAVLARVEAPEIQAQLSSAEATLRLTRQAAERSAQLFRGGIVTAPENERDQLALAAAQATRDQLRARAGFATVRAPSAGVVLERTVRTGDLAAPQLRLFTIGDVSTLVVRVPVSELDVTALRTGAPAEVLLDALPGRTLAGRVRRIFPAADSASRLVPVEVALPGASPRQVRPGFLARVTFRLEPRTGVLLVPATAVLENPRGAVVYVVRAGRASLRTVERGATYEGRVEIREGLAAGDTVITAGNTLVRDSGAVRIVGGADVGTGRGDTAATRRAAPAATPAATPATPTPRAR
jgi:membrane fusion protein (multidrug efflux system)